VCELAELRFDLGNVEREVTVTETERQDYGEIFTAEV